MSMQQTPGGGTYPNGPRVRGLTRVLPEGLLANPAAPEYLTHSYNRKWSKGLEDGWVPYWLTTDTNPLVLPPSTAAQLPAQNVTLQGDCIVEVADWCATSSYILAQTTTVFPDFGFRFSCKFGSRVFGLDNSPTGIKGEMVFGTAQHPGHLPGGEVWLIEPGTSQAILQFTLTNTTTTSNTIELLLRGWRRNKQNG